MRGFLKAALLILGLMLVLVLSVPAFTVTSITIDPSGPMTPGTPVIVTGRIDFTPSPGEKFDSRHDLRFNTTLEIAQWTWASYTKGSVTPTRQPGIIPPVDPPFHYPQNENVFMKFTVQGKAPAVNKTANITLLRILETDEKGEILAGSIFERTVVIVNKTEVADKIQNVEANLSRFKSRIDEKAAMGINTSAAEEKYWLAEQDLISPCDKCVFSEEFKNIDKAEAAITDGERLLDRAWAEKVIADAADCINKVDKMGLRANSTDWQADAPVHAIVAKREKAVAYLITADNLTAAGDYSVARQNAAIALELCNETYAEALVEYKEQNPPPSSRVPLIVVAGIGIVVILIIGVWWWKREKEAMPE